MKKLSKHFRALPVVVLCLLAVGGAAAFAQRQYASRASVARPEIKVLLSGAVERKEGRTARHRREASRWLNEARGGSGLDVHAGALRVGRPAGRRRQAFGFLQSAR
jgi:hypothetical protein